MRRLVLGLAVLGWVTACGGSSEFESSRENAEPVPLEELPEQLAAAYCAVVERCSGVLFDFVFAEEECERLTAERWRQNGLAQLEEAIEDGRVVYRPERARSCLDALAGKVCAELDQRESPACEAALEGTVGEDGACALDEECRGSLICETAGQCPGRCVERYGAGVECGEDDECADGLVCSKATAHCAEPAALGEPCDGTVEVQCEAGLLCVGNDDNAQRPGTCRPLSSVVEGSAGGACDPTEAELCADGLSCVLVATGLGGLQWECRAQVESGAICGLGLPEQCPQGEYCPLGELQIALGTFEAACEPLPVVGEACREALLAFVPRCEAYARCGADGRCVGLRDLGDTCFENESCYSASCVDGVCEPARACR